MDCGLKRGLTGSLRNSSTAKVERNNSQQQYKLEPDWLGSSLMEGTWH